MDQTPIYTKNNCDILRGMKNLLKYFLIGTLWTVFVLAGCQSSQVETFDETSEEFLDDPLAADMALISLRGPDDELPVSSFREVWGYLVVDREFGMNPAHAVTDLAYFGAGVNRTGRLTGVPDFNRIAHFQGRKHLVASCNGQALSYFALLEGRPERQALIGDLIRAAGPYDGLQINFEYVPARSSEAYLSFLRELRAGLGDRILSVAIAARTRTLQNDVYDYGRVLPLVDRMLVMAYDEHWSTSAPGPIASMGWSQRVARYSLETIGTEKLIMGLPFYGRRWGNFTPNMAFIHSGIENIINEQDITEIQRDNSIPNFKYETTVSMTVYYEDEYSLATRMDMYKKMGVNAVGFWRLGQETPEFWPYIKLEM